MANFLIHNECISQCPHIPTVCRRRPCCCSVNNQEVTWAFYRFDATIIFCVKQRKRNENEQPIQSLIVSCLFMLAALLSGCHGICFVRDGIFCDFVNLQCLVKLMRMIQDHHRVTLAISTFIWNGLWQRAVIKLFMRLWFCVFELHPNASYSTLRPKGEHNRYRKK